MGGGRRVWFSIQYTCTTRVLPQKLEFIGVIKRICVFQSRALTLIDKLKWQTAGSPTLRLQPLAAACCTEPFMRWNSVLWAVLLGSQSLTGSLSAATNPVAVARAIISIPLLARLLAALLRHLLHPVKKKKKKAQSVQEALGFSTNPSSSLCFNALLHFQGRWCHHHQL